MRREIRIAGFGGQGIGLTGFILGKALALYDGKEAVMTQAYGPEARGGASSANIVTADESIDYPFVQQPDILVALSQEAYTRFRPTARPQALILIEQDLVMPEAADQVRAVPATRLAEELGRRIVTNLVMLGFFTAVSGLVSRQAVEQAIQTTVKPATIPLNLQAFATGYDYASQPEEAPVEADRGRLS
ncbi:MAG TPA: 2-oxoacid:acceptor oxidoreductase family protein [Anaerolineales bacterium]|nr:2-oxoacid:acceptor oxidoreductase family protein [Anaerolineales bacterium]